MLQKKDRSKLLFFKESSFKVAELIFNRPNTSFHIRELARKTGLSTTAVIRAAEELAGFSIVSIEKTALTTNIKADLESDTYMFYKKVFNLYRLEQYNILSTIKEAYRAKTIVLFGSFAKGEDVEGSDVDILVLTNSKEKVDLNEELEAYKKVLNRDINLHVLRSIDKSYTEFKNALANGIVLHGYLKVV